MKKKSTRGMVKTLFFVLSAMLFQALLTQPTSAQVAETFPQLVSVDSDGSPITAYYWGYNVSYDGRYVTFHGGNSGNSSSEVFIHDRISGLTERITTEGDNSAISADGRYVIFASSFSESLFIYDRVNNTTNKINTTRVVGSQVNAGGHSLDFSISPDARYIAYNGSTSGIFLYDRITNLTERVGSSPGSYVSISADGRYVTSRYSDQIFVYDRVTEIAEMANVDSDGNPIPSYFSFFNISADGRYVVFYGDGVYLRDRINKTTELIYYNASHPFISADGRYVSFSAGTFKGFYDRETGLTGSIGIGGKPIISGDGRYAVYSCSINGYPSMCVNKNPLFGKPTADAGQNQTVLIGSTVTLDGSKSTDPNGDYPLSYSWTFASTPSGSNAIINNPTSVNPTFLADGSGVYIASLIVTDSDGKTSQSVEVQISTTNTAPVADAGIDQHITNIGSQVILDGSNSYDVDGDAITHHWNIVSKPYGSNAELISSTAEKPTFIADVHGDYVISLTVSDNWSTSVADQVTIGFDNIQPVANAGNNQAVVEGDTVNLNGNQSTDANGDNLTYRWSIVSMPEGSNATLTSTDSVNTSFTADTVGQYVINLIVNDGFVDSEPSVANVVAISHQDAATQELMTTIDTINDIPVDAFNNPNNVNALTNKINAALGNIDSGNYADALNQLQNDILGKTDGCAVSGAPDNNDWITTDSKNPTQEEIQQACQKQSPVYMLLMQAIGYLESLI